MHQKCLRSDATSCFYSNISTGVPSSPPMARESFFTESRLDLAILVRSISPTVRGSRILPNIKMVKHRPLFCRPTRPHQRYSIKWHRRCKDSSADRRTKSHQAALQKDLPVKTRNMTSDHLSPGSGPRPGISGCRRKSFRFRRDERGSVWNVSDEHRKGMKMTGVFTPEGNISYKR